MKVEVKKIDKIKRKLRVEIAGDELLKEKNSFYQEQAKHLKVPGFRPGNIPFDILEKHHGKLLGDELLKKVLPLFYKKALESQNIIPASMPQIYDVKLEPQSLVFSADFEAKPQVEVQDSIYRGIKIKDSNSQVTDSEIDKVIDSVREEAKKVIKIELTDEILAKWASYPTLEAFRQAISSQLSVEKLRQRRGKVEEQVRKHLLKECSVDLPAAEVERHKEELLNRQLYQLSMQGIAQEDIDKYKSDLEAKLKVAAEDDVRLFYILEAVARREQIPVDDNLANTVFGYILSQAQYQL